MNEYDIKIDHIFWGDGISGDICDYTQTIKLTEQQLRDVIAYINSMKVEKE